MAPRTRLDRLQSRLTALPCASQDRQSDLIIFIYQLIMITITIEQSHQCFHDPVKGKLQHRSGQTKFASFVSMMVVFQTVGKLSIRKNVVVPVAEKNAFFYCHHFTYKFFIGFLTGLINFSFLSLLLLFFFLNAANLVDDMDKEHQANEPTIFKVSNNFYKLIFKNFLLS